MSADLQELLQGPISASASTTTPNLDSSTPIVSTDPSTDHESWPTGTVEEKQSVWRARLLGKLFVETSAYSAENTDTFSEQDLPPDTRVIRPGEGVLMDYVEERFNVDLNDAGRVKSVWFG